MRRIWFGWTAAALAVYGLGALVCPAGGLEVGELSCEYSTHPVGVQTPQPRFGWVLRSDRRSEMQTAYRVLVSGNEQALARDKGDQWDSGKITSSESVGVVYGGRPLASGERCFWKLRCWDKEGKASPWSAVARFEMGLLNESDWQGEWIGAGPTAGPPDYIPGKWGQGVFAIGREQTIRIPHDPKLKPVDGITLAAWVRPGDPQGGGRGWRCIYRKDDGNARQVLAIGRSGRIEGLWAGFGIGGRYVEYGAPASIHKLRDGRWHLLAASYDGSAVRLFVDGDEIGSKAASGKLDTAGTKPVYLGSNKGQSEFYMGGIDDVRVYGRGLSEDELRELNGGGDVSGGLVGWWKVDGDLVNSISGVAGEAKGYQGPAPLLRKAFQVDREVVRATVYMSGIGWSELYVNGAKVSDRVLDPAATDYDKRVFYVTHDLTSALKRGENVLGVMLGHGWYSEQPGPNYGDSPRLRVQMNIQFADGTRTSIVSDGSWKVTDGPILRNSMHGGETYDARLEKAGWTRAGFDDTGWSAAKSVSAPGGRMEAQLMPPMRVNETFKPKKLTNPAPGVYVFEMPQLVAGWVRLRVKGPAGTKVTIKYSGRGRLLESGLIDSLRHPEPGATDYYILRGDPAGELYEPRFTFHPVRYVQIEGYPGEPALEDLEARAVHTAVDLSGDFDCSNPLFNRIHRNAVWTLRNELYGIPMDCIYREHWGWLEPGTNPSTLAHRKYMPLFWEKFLDDCRYAQHEDGVIPDVVPAYPLKGRTTGDIAWAGNYPLVVWYVYQYFDDRRLLEEHYASMKKWMEHLVSISSGNLVTKGYYGDHMLPGPKPGEEVFLSGETPKELLRSAFYYKDALVLGQVAETLGKIEDARRYSELAASIRKAINSKWFDEAKAQYATGSQTANLMGLVMGMAPEGSRSRVLENIAGSIREHGHFHTGNVGTAHLMEASLADRGLGELMYEVMNRTTYPGFGYMVAQGATTLWEAWGLREDVGLGEESMDMWGCVEEFFYKDLAGIRPPDYYGPRVVKPGFREVEIRPHVLGDLTEAKATVRTVRGMVSSRWKIADGRFVLEVEIPVNSTARVSVPVSGTSEAVVREGERIVWEKGAYVPEVEGVSGATAGDDFVTFQVGSGSYRFSAPVPARRVEGR